MVRNEYRERWAQWLPSALTALAMDPPDYSTVMPQMPLPLSQSEAFARFDGPPRVALLTTSGAYDVRTQAPFAATSIVGDPTHRVFDSKIPRQHIAFAHEHFDRSFAQSDLECVVPRDTVHACGVEVTPHIISWTGFLLDWPTFIEATIPQIVAQVKTDGANAAIIVPI